MARTLTLLAAALCAVTTCALPLSTVTVTFNGTEYDPRTLPRIDDWARGRELGTRIVGGTAVSSGVLFQAILWKYARDSNGNIETDPNGQPYLSFACGGSLITSTTVLTAAHCLPGFVAVEVGDYTPFNTPYTGDFVNVTQEIGHGSYNDATSENDIAVLRIQTAITRFPTIPLIFQNPAYAVLDDTGAQLRVSGWGATSSGGSISTTLLQVTVPVISNAQCGASFSYGSRFKPTSMMCAGSMSGGVDSCQGDSGGPLFGVVGGQDVQVGVVSWGDGCAGPNKPGVYTRLTTYESWLRSNVPGLPPAAGTPTPAPSTAKPTTAKPTTAKPTTAKPTTAKPTTAKPTTATPTTAKPTTAKPTTAKPTTAKPTTAKPSAAPIPGVAITTAVPTREPSAATTTSGSATTQTDSPASSSNMPLIIGAGGGALVLLALVASLAVTSLRRRRQRASGAALPTAFSSGPPGAPVSAHGKFAYTEASNPYYRA